MAESGSISDYVSLGRKRILGRLTSSDLPSEPSGPAPVHSVLPLAQRVASEAVGTFCMVFAAAGSAMADGISGGAVTLLGAALASGLAVALVVHATGHISGAHINPAVTLGFALAGVLRVRDAVPYWAAQMAGAVIAAYCLRAMFGPVAYVGGHFPHGGNAASFGMEIVITFTLMFVIMAVVTDRRAPAGTAALAIGAAVAVGILVAGTISGGSMNPARTFGPALASGNWAGHWLYWAGPIVGACLAAVSYGRLFPRPRGAEETGIAQDDA